MKRISVRHMAPSRAVEDKATAPCAILLDLTPSGPVWLLAEYVARLFRGEGFAWRGKASGLKTWATLQCA
jgi:hypothetical protein